MEQNNYRLERWIGILLGLLFFLPFIARADELLYTQSFHRDEIRHQTGDKFLALVVTDGVPRLEPVSIRVKNVYDPFEDLDGETSGKRIEVDGIEDAYLFRSARLRPGNVIPATPLSTELALDAPTAITFAGIRYTLDYRCGNAPDADGIVECALVLENHDTTQVLGKVFTFWEARNDLGVFFALAGDLDGDHKLDLLVDLSADEHEWHPALFLSSAAREGELVAKVAELVSSSC